MFDVQGHRGARGLKPENTLPAFEAALDLMVTTLEGDLHLTRDAIPILAHDEVVSTKLARLAPGAKAPDPKQRPRVSTLTLAELREYVVDQNPDKKRFPKQDASPTSVADTFCKKLGIAVYSMPTLEHLFAFVAAYAGALGKRAGKSEAQRKRAGEVKFNLELKRVPFFPQNIGDDFDGKNPGTFERNVAEVVRKANVVQRTIIQSFDHRSVLAIRKLEPKLTGAVLIYGTGPVSVPRTVHDAGAQVYSPDYEFLDAEQVKQAHGAKIRVIPWTVNEVEPMKQLLDMGVDGIITDFPDRLIPLLQARHIAF